MNLEERLAKYLDRDFSLEQAQILVLMEEAAIALFAALPEHFVLFGGATLVLFHNSPRLSNDLDLLARVDSLPSAGELQNALQERVQEVAGLFGIGPVTFEPEQNAKQFLRLWMIGSRKQRLFTVDLTRVGGSVLAREIVDETIVLDESTALIPCVSRNYQLLQKAETFVSRRMMKTRDAFDMRLLLAEGAVLDETLKAHLNDLVMWRELDAEQINERVEQITPKLCRAELKSVLPEEVYSSLEVEEFESLRAAVRTLFAEWL
jgi:Nucleotidyl transferase AbiEii toxin, Type IV TA system